ncbi:MAG: hypothetical protein P8P29_05830 [Flavobacteriaceae bacterium]|nr:hypothetical protein [Flavobacteriaceae bacterium]
MATAIAKQNGTVKKETVTPKKAVQKKLAEQATGKASAPVTNQEKIVEKPAIISINLDDRMQRFEQLQGLARQRERLTSTLTDLNKFKYNQSDSASFYIKDSDGLEFKTTNTNLIHLVTNHLKNTLETRKTEIEKQLVTFEL